MPWSAGCPARKTAAAPLIDFQGRDAGGVQRCGIIGTDVSDACRSVQNDDGCKLTRCLQGLLESRANHYHLAILFNRIRKIIDPNRGKVVCGARRESPREEPYHHKEERTQ